MTRGHRVPTGTVTFLFSDIEGSTQRWEAHREAMDAAVRRHDAHVRAAIEGYDGYVFKTVGDAFCAAFARVSQAVAASVAAQRALDNEDFSSVDGVRVRMALHTGEAVEREGDYFGPAVNRVARLMAIGHGEQVLISAITRDLAADGLPAGVTLADLGLHRLRDLTQPEHVWQLDIAGRRTEFPPLRSLDAHPNNLPIARTSFVGRQRDVAEVKDLLAHARLLTLVGSGGVGKTRLAIAVGAETIDRFPDGVWFADLAPIGDPELVASVVARALGMSQQQGQRVDETIPAWLRRKKLLLIADNCEHVLEPVAALADAILATAPDVAILATSRQGLDLDGESVYRLSSLAVPADAGALAAGDAIDYGAVALFVDRAKAADARFALTDQSAPIVAEICRRLDGIALAVELAAARVKMLSLPTLAQRLDERFKLLTGASRNALPRQKTLTALIDWSYDLLAPPEQTLFARLGIFAGGFGLDAATAVCGGDGLEGTDVFELLASLTDKSLVVADTSGERERYRLLESTAAYALEKLVARGESDRLARNHAGYFRERAEAAYEQVPTVATIAWLASVEPELDNFRAALEWALTRENDAVLGGKIVGALWKLWLNAGLGAEGRYWLELALPRVDQALHPAIVARLALALGTLTYGKGKYDAARQAIPLCEAVGDLRGAAQAHRLCGFALYQMGRLDEASDAIAHALNALRELGDTRNVPYCLDLLASIACRKGDPSTGLELFAQALAGVKALGDDVQTAWILSHMAELEFARGNAQQSLQLIDEALDLTSSGKSPAMRSAWYGNGAAYRIALGDLAGARASAQQGLHLGGQQGGELAPWTLQHLALLAALAGDSRRAATLLGYVNVLYGKLAMQREPTEQWSYEKLLAALHETLGDEQIATLGAEGAAWPEDRAISEALAVSP